MIAKVRPFLIIVIFDGDCSINSQLVPLNGVDVAEALIVGDGDAPAPDLPQTRQLERARAGEGDEQGGLLRAPRLADEAVPVNGPEPGQRHLGMVHVGHQQVAPHLADVLDVVLLSAAVMGRQTLLEISTEYCKVFTI